VSQTRTLICFSRTLLLTVYERRQHASYSSHQANQASNHGCRAQGATLLLNNSFENRITLLKSALLKYRKKSGKNQTPSPTIPFNYKSIHSNPRACNKCNYVTQNSPYRSKCSRLAEASTGCTFPTRRSSSDPTGDSSPAVTSHYISHVCVCSYNLGDPIATAGSVLLSNIKEGRIPKFASPPPSYFGCIFGRLILLHPPPPLRVLGTNLTHRDAAGLMASCCLPVQCT
jgi:hypothetical protein